MILFCFDFFYKKKLSKLGIKTSTKISEKSKIIIFFLNKKKQTNKQTTKTKFIMIHSLFQKKRI